MWTSLCNYLWEKLFHRQEINDQLKNTSEKDLYGKRLKLNSYHSELNDLPSSDSSGLVSMLKQSLTKTDDEDECYVIAEIPRRKKAENPSNINNIQICTPLKGDFSNSLLENVETKTNDEISKELELWHDTTNNSNTSKHLKPGNKNFKYFKSPRSTLSQSKVLKSRLMCRNQLKKRMNFLQESYRLAERVQYIQLLQSHTTYNLLTDKPKFKKITYTPTKIPIIDLTDDNVNENEEKSKLENQLTEDQDLQIVCEISGVRSFQDMLKISDMKKDMKNLKQLDSKHILESIDSSSFEKKTIKKNSLLDINDDKKSNDENIKGIQKTSADDLEEKIRAFMNITGTKIREVDYIEEQYSLPEITAKQEKKIQKALVLHPSQEILAEGFGLKITRRDMHTLNSLNWLNDEIINFYLNLIMERSNNNKCLPKVYSFNTFFYPKLVSYGYMSLRRWTKSVDIFGYDIILVPIHLGMHWCMSVIDFRCKAVQYYDSVGSPNDSCLDSLLTYLKAESMDKKKKIFFTSDWEKTNVEDVPQQMNGSDCGVFSCMFAEHIARDCGIYFSQDDMPYFRKKMVIEILEKKLLT